MEIKGLRFGILGLARSGVATALKILNMGGSVFISELKSKDESRQDILNRFNEEIWDKLLPYCEFGQHSDKIFNSDLLIVSPGISSKSDLIQKAQQKKIKTISEIEFGYLIKNKQSRIIAVTGSNGKSTTVSLIHHLLQSAGCKNILAGNIGNPMTAFPIEKPGIDYIVLELSSFQLELIEDFHPDTAVFLNISADHLDRHNTLEEYFTIKMNIFKNQTINDRAVLNASDQYLFSRSRDINSHQLLFSMGKANLPSDDDEAMYLEGKTIIRQQNKTTKIEIDTSNTHLFGVHNQMNMMAAILAVSNVIKDTAIINRALKSFLPLPHRLEKVAEHNGIVFINDSKATNTDSVKYALTAFEKPIHLIAGGYEKGEDYTVLLPYLKDNVKRIYLIGNARAKMQLAFQTLTNKISTHVTMIDAVSSAYNEALAGDVILLSPACASFDMYKNFEHRGDVFRTIVKELVKNEN